MNRSLLWGLLVSVAIVLLDPFVRFVVIRVDRDLVPLVGYFAVANEGNLPSWWSTALLVLLAGALASVGLVRTDLAAGHRRGWFAAAAVAAAISLDEMTSLHEQLGPLAQSVLDDQGWAIPTYAWLLPGSVLAAGVVTASLVWARGLLPDVRTRVTSGLALFFAGAVGMEATAGLLKNAGHRTGYYVATLIEETLEMAGTLMALSAPALMLLMWIRSQAATHRVSPGEGRPRDALATAHPGGEGRR